MTLTSLDQLTWDEFLSPYIILCLQNVLFVVKFLSSNNIVPVGRLYCIGVVIIIPFRV